MGIKNDKDGVVWNAPHRATRIYVDIPCLALLEKDENGKDKEAKRLAEIETKRFFLWTINTVSRHNSAPFVVEGATETLNLLLYCCRDSLYLHYCEGNTVVAARTSFGPIEFRVTPNMPRSRVVVSSLLNRMYK